MCYLMMEKNMEGFINGFDPSVTNKFTNLGSLSGKNDRNYITLNETSRYVFNTGSTSRNTNNIYDGLLTPELSGNFTFTSNTSDERINGDISYNAFLYKNSTTTVTDSLDISYDLYNLSLLGTYDLSSVPKTSTTVNYDLSKTTNLLLVVDNSGYFYDISGLNKKVGFNLILDNKYLIQNGRFISPIEDINLPSSTATPTSSATTSSTGWSGDLNFEGLFKGLNSGRLPPNMTPEMAVYMMQGSMGSGNQGYAMPYYNSFESAMNNPSNPLVNPTNAMNPLQYNESLFGPNITPMMSQNMCKNSSADKGEKVREDVKEDSKSKDSTINSSLGSNNVLNSTFDKLNSSANTMLAQNTGDEGKGGSSGTGTGTGTGNGNPPPCPPCARCPESNYECKKVPAYEQGYENTALPRPVLSDFSTFGM